MSKFSHSSLEVDEEFRAKSGAASLADGEDGDEKSPGIMADQ